jgi:signal peptidase I
MAEGDVRPPGGSEPGGSDPAPAYVPKHARIDPPPPEPQGPPQPEAPRAPEPSQPEPPARPEALSEPIAAPAAGEPPPSEPPAAQAEVEGEGAEPAPAGKPPKAGVNPFVELILILAVAFGLAYLVQGWVVKPYRIPSVSMEPTLQVGDMVLVNRFIYRIHPPRRGDIIVFHPPGRGQVPIRGATTEASVNYIKRVIGLPGETIQIAHGTVFICSAPHVGCKGLNEPYVATHDYGNYGPYTVPQGDYFVMGDNRGNSDDSRVWGPLPRKNIIGEAFMIYWPLNRLGTL